MSLSLSLSRFVCLAAPLLLLGNLFAAPTEPELIALLKNPGAPLADKMNACRQLQRMGTKSSIPALAALLSHEQLSHMARYALQSIPEPAVDSAFRSALYSVKGKPLVGIISSVGARRDTAAVEPLIAQLKNTDPEVVQAAARALGAIGSTTAARALEDAWTTAAPENRLAVGEGLLRAAEALFLARQRDPALAIFSKLRLPDVPQHIRTAATRGVVMCAADVPGAVLAELLRANDIRAVSAAVRTGMDALPTLGVLESLMQAAGQTTGDRKLLILQAIGQSGDPAALPALIAAAKLPSRDVQIAAVRAMAELRNPAAVPVLAGLLGDPAVGPAARDSLASLPGGEADAVAIKLLQSPEKAQRSLGLELAARRHLTAQLPAVLQALADPDPALRQTALRCAGELGGSAQIPLLLDLLGKASAADLPATEEAAAKVLARTSEAEAAAAIQARLTKAPPAQKIPLVRLLGSIGGPAALNASRAPLADGDKRVRETTIAALMSWKSPDAAPLLLQSAQKSADPSERLLALKGYCTLVSRGASQEPEKRIALCQEAAKVVQRPEEKKLLASTLGSIPAPGAVTLLLAYADDPATRAEACSAALTLAGKLIGGRKTPPAAVRELIAPLQKLAQTAEGKTAAQASALLQQAQAISQ